MKKSLLIAFALIFALIPLFSSCANRSPEPTEEEIELVREELDVRGYSGSDYYVCVLYDANESAKYLFGVNERAYIVIDRSKKEFIECGEDSNPFKDYMDLKKYYGGICTFLVYDESNPDAPYHCLTRDTWGTSVRDALKWK